MSTLEVPQLPGMMISKVAAPPSSPRKLERKAPCIPGLLRNTAQLGWELSVSKTPWDPMGQHQNCLESMVETSTEWCFARTAFF